MSATVAKCAEWADALAKAESSGLGDYGHALKRVARRLRLSHGTLAGLLYRQPKDVWASTYLALESAYEAMRQQQLRALQNDIETARIAGRVSPHLLEQAQALVELAREG